MQSTVAFRQTGARLPPRALNYIEKRPSYFDEEEGPPAPEGSVVAGNTTYVPDEQKQLLAQGAATIGVALLTTAGDMFSRGQQQQIAQPAPKKTNPLLIGAVAIALIVAAVVAVKVVR